MKGDAKCHRKKGRKEKEKEKEKKKTTKTPKHAGYAMQKIIKIQIFTPSHFPSL
jgi:hypothetical protein